MGLVNHARRSYTANLAGLRNDENEIDLIQGKLGAADTAVDFNLADAYFTNNVIDDMLRAGADIDQVIQNHLADGLNVDFIANGGDFHDDGGDVFLRRLAHNREHFVRAFNDFFVNSIPTNSDNLTRVNNGDLWTRLKLE